MCSSRFNLTGFAEKLVCLQKRLLAALGIIRLPVFYDCRRMAKTEYLYRSSARPYLWQSNRPPVDCAAPTFHRAARYVALSGLIQYGPTLQLCCRNTLHQFLNVCFSAHDRAQHVPDSFSPGTARGKRLVPFHVDRPTVIRLVHSNGTCRSTNNDFANVGEVAAHVTFIKFGLEQDYSLSADHAGLLPRSHDRYNSSSLVPKVRLWIRRT